MNLAAPTETASAPRPAKVDERARSLIFTRARTSNSFADVPVSDEELRDIWELTRWTPTAMNIQPLRVVYIRTHVGKDRLVPLMAEGNRAKTATAPAVAILAYDSEWHDHLPTVFPIAPGQKERFEADTDARHGTGELNFGLQAGAFILAVRAAGLAAGPMGGFDHAAVDQEFFPDGRWKSRVVVNIGHPGENPWFDRLPRIGTDTAVAWA